MSSAEVANSPHKTGRARRAKCTSVVLGVVSAAILTCTGIQPAGAARYERLLAGLQSQDTSSLLGSSARWRRSVAGTLHVDCKAGLTRVVWHSPSVGVTEEGPSDISAMRREFAHWRLTTIFHECAELTQEILSAANAQREIRAWVKLTRLLGDDQAIRTLIEMAGVSPARHDEAGVADLTDTGHWRSMRDAIFDAMLKLLDETE
jgi:hypothetical protein